MGFFSSFFGGGQSQEEADANIARQEQLLREQANRRFDAGEITQEKFDRDMQFIATVGGAEDVGAAWSEGFGEGWDEGKANIEKFSWGAIRNFLGSVPSLVWIGLVIFLFLNFGGLAWAKKKLKL